jgi:hypothetical protein
MAAQLKRDAEEGILRLPEGNKHKNQRRASDENGIDSNQLAQEFSSGALYVHRCGSLQQQHAKIKVGNTSASS